MPPDPVPRRAILHFGPPKTGTSALQAWCAAHRDALARHDVHYADVDRPDDPKHQWLLQALQTGHFDRLHDTVARHPSGTLILSCEGIMVQRGKIAPDHWAAFRAALTGFQRHLFLVQRDPEDWMRSLWRQGVLNPVGSGGLAMPSLDAFATSPWLREMLDLPSLARRLAQAAGADGITIAPYRDDWLAAFRSLAGLPDGAVPAPLPRVHDSPPEAFLQLYLALAAGHPRVGPLRQTLFAVYVGARTTTNLTLQNTARAFRRRDRTDQARHLQALITALAHPAAGVGEVAALAADLRATATAWHARL